METKMKRIMLSVLAATFSTATAVAEEAYHDEIFQRPEPQAEVILVGTYHFANPGADSFNLEADDVLTEQRQHEIEAVVARLSEWKPDLVMVEWPRTSQESTDARYAEYRNGEHRDKRNEIYQLGFRLAGALNHERVAAVDVQHEFFSEQQTAIEEAQGDRYRAISEQMNRYGNAFITASQEIMSSSTIGDTLAWYNSNEALVRNHDFYVRYQMRQWQDENQGGAYTVANWYTRNILIFQNMLREIEESDGRVKRVVAFYGQGHVPILAQLIEDTPFLTLADPVPYLTDSGRED